MRAQKLPPQRRPSIEIGLRVRHGSSSGVSTAVGAFIPQFFGVSFAAQVSKPFCRQRHWRLFSSCSSRPREIVCDLALRRVGSPQPASQLAEQDHAGMLASVDRTHRSSARCDRTLPQQTVIALTAERLLVSEGDQRGRLQYCEGIYQSRRGRYWPRRSLGKHALATLFVGGSEKPV
jgi:hypothetical protein